MRSTTSAAERMKKMAVKYICKHPGCQETVDTRGTYCEDHQDHAKREEAERKPFATATRSNQNYYNTHEWKELRKSTVKKQGFCQRCGSTKELQVHHLQPPRGSEKLFFSPWNLEVICVDCHRLETAAEIRDRNRYGGLKK